MLKSRIHFTCACKVVSVVVVSRRSALLYVRLTSVESCVRVGSQIVCGLFLPSSCPPRRGETISHFVVMSWSSASSRVHPGLVEFFVHSATRVVRHLPCSCWRGSLIVVAHLVSGRLRVVEVFECCRTEHVLRSRIDTSEPGPTSENTSEPSPTLHVTLPADFPSLQVRNSIRQRRARK